MTVNHHDTAPPTIYDEGPVYSLGVVMDSGEDCVTLELLKGHGRYRCRIPMKSLLEHKALRNWLLDQNSLYNGSVVAMRPIPTDILMLISEASKAYPVTKQSTPPDKPWAKEFLHQPAKPEPRPPDPPRLKRLVKV